MKLPNQSDRQGPRPGWLVLFVALSLILITVWFREGETGPVHRLRIGVQSVVAPFSAAGEWATGPVRGLIAWAGDLGVSRSELEALREQNSTLRARVAELEEARLENERLRGLLEIEQARELDAIGARVIGRPTNAWEGVITIDRGTADGIKAGMPVIGPDGLLGQTVQVGRTSARVRLITDQRSGVAALVQRNRAEGIVRGSIEGELSLEFVSKETTLKAGDVIITSGLGGVYPKGIVIGEIAELTRRPNDLYRSATVAPAGNVTSLEEVLVLIGYEMADTPNGGE